tara:strand:+ start:1422 stop:1835 length:414 start_codon:yes stop_codon:yes gene_type:complete
MNYLFAIALLFLGGCSFRALYPTAGAVIGGGAGSIAGPVGGAIGAGAGAATGQLLAGDEELQDAKDTITAISRGDVEGMLAAATGKQKGFVDEAIDGVIGFVKLCLIFLVLWNLIPIIYTRYIHKKHSNGNSEKTDT